MPIRLPPLLPATASALGAAVLWALVLTVPGGAIAQSVYVNYDLLLKVDGHKFYPIGLLELGADRYPYDWNQRIRDTGANLVWDIGVAYLDGDPSCEAVRDSAEAAGYRLMAGSPDTWEWDNSSTPELEVAKPIYEADSLATMLGCFQSSDRLISLANRDEPVWSQYRGVIGDIDSVHIMDTFDQLKDASGHRVVSINFAPVHASEDLQTWMNDISGYLPATEVVMFASYPYPAGPGTCNPINVVGWPECAMDRLPESIDLFLGSINLVNQPLWAIIQAFKGIPLKEARWEAHVAVIHRATGLIWAGWTWTHAQGNGDENWPVTVQVMSEMSSLQDVLVRSDRNGVNSLHPDLDVRGKRGVGDETVKFAASRRGASGPMTFTVGGAEGDWAEALWEDRWIPVVDGTVTDHFEDYESHVYRLAPGGAPGLDAPAPAVAGGDGIFRLRAFPNPATDASRVAFLRPEGATVAFTVHDVTGRRLASPRPDDGPGSEGHVVWDGRDEQGRPAPAGLYFLRGVASDGQVATVRLVRR